MAVLAPTQNERRPTVREMPSFAATKRWLSKTFYEELNRHVATDDGDYRTNAQLMVEGVVSMATDPTKDDYVRLAASKFIVEHLEGKASAMQEERHEEMPRLVICVGDPMKRDLDENAEKFKDAVPSSDIEISITDEDGSNRQDYVVEAD